MSEPDTDVDRDEGALNIGKAFHMVVEKCKHDKQPTLALVKEACKVHSCVDSQALVHAMTMKNYKLHKRTGLTCLATEFEISNPIFIGYVDAVLGDKLGWWVTDLKTASNLSDTKVARLHKDVQLNLYASFAEMIAKMFKLDPAKFRGARYRVTTKSLIKPLKDEAYESYVKRLYSAIESIDVIVPREIMAPEKAFALHKRLHALSMALREGKIKPRQNYSHCDSYFTPCEFWSKCHGDNFTVLKEKLVRIDADRGKV
jgi:hypothetical protein